MSSLDILWVDARQRRTVPGMFAALPPSNRVGLIADLYAIPATVEHYTPRLACFEFDHPDAAGLKGLHSVLRRYVSLPVVMLTEHHSERLAVWAFRSGVWDYLVKPVAVKELDALLATLDHAIRQGRSRKRDAPPPPLEECLAVRTMAARTTSAMAYIEAHIDHRIELATLARLCCLSYSEFSRVFHREHGLTAREFIMRTRIDKACQILRRTAASISQAAYAVGFDDLSHFTRVFRQRTGVSPSEYRRACEPAS